MLDADVKERVCDLAWELGYDWDGEKVEDLFKSFISQHPEADELPTGVQELYKLIQAYEEELRIA